MLQINFKYWLILQFQHLHCKNSYSEKCKKYLNQYQIVDPSGSLSANTQKKAPSYWVTSNQANFFIN
jgi:hypothetical protein